MPSRTLTTRALRTRNGADMNDHDHKPYLLTLLFIGTIALSVFLWWVARLTGGPENGGRYDVPAINGAAWWGFLVSIPAVLLVGGQFMSRLEERVDSRRRRRRRVFDGVGNDHLDGARDASDVAKPDPAR